MFKNIKIGEQMNVVCLITNITNTTASNGNNYQKCTIRDEDGDVITVNMFNDKIEDKVPCLKSLVIEAGEFNKNKSYKARLSATPVPENLDTSSFFPKERIDLGKEWNDLTIIVKELSENFARPVCKVLNKCNRDAFKNNPLSSKDYFARRGGILEATGKLVSLAKSAAIEFPFLNRDLMIAVACILYTGGVEAVSPNYEDTISSSLISISDRTAIYLAQSCQPMTSEVEAMYSILVKKEYSPLPEGKVISYLSKVVLEMAKADKHLEGVEKGELVKEGNESYYQI